MEGEGLQQALLEPCQEQSLSAEVDLKMPAREMRLSWEQVPIICLLCMPSYQGKEKEVQGKKEAAKLHQNSSCA